MQGAEQYKKVGINMGILEASPHRVIQMLMQGFIDRVSSAKGAMQRKDYAGKSNLINKAIDIARGLQVSLDMETQGEISTDLYQLYAYMMERLSEANRDNNIELLNEAVRLMSTIKEGWDGIPEDTKEKYSMHKVECGQ